MAEEPTLPPMPSVSWNPGTQSFNNTRKRNRGNLNVPPPNFNNSSDPAIFSSDDDAGVENYSQGKRRKRRYVGSWFQQHLASGDSAFNDEDTQPRGQAQKRTFERQYDSGVFMASDALEEMDEDADSGFALPALGQSKLPCFESRPAMDAHKSSEVTARETIMKAVEDGNQDIELTAMGLEHLSNEAIAPLKGFSLIPSVVKGVSFKQEQPALKVYLANNPLRQVPGALLNLNYLTVLSLRNTDIAELPPAIINLKNLQTLNLSLTQLRYIPAELLNLFLTSKQLDRLLLHPNPFHHPKTKLPFIDFRNAEDTSTASKLAQALFSSMEPESGGTVEFMISGVERTRQARLMGRSPLQFNETSGIIRSKFRLPELPVSSGDSHEASFQIETETLGTAPFLGDFVSASRVPSLLESTLRNLYKTSELDVVYTYLPEHTPDYLKTLLRRVANQAYENANGGNVHCSSCGCRSMIPLFQWIEWWDLGVRETSNSDFRPLFTQDEERAIPFLRRVCSAPCVFAATAVRDCEYDKIQS